MNAKRPNLPAEASKIPPAGNVNSGGQKHDNMAPFSPQPKKYEEGIVVMGETQPSSLGGKESILPEEGTGRQ